MDHASRFSYNKEQEEQLMKVFEKSDQLMKDMIGNSITRRRPASKKEEYGNDSWKAVHETKVYSEKRAGRTVQILVMERETKKCRVFLVPEEDMTDTTLTNLDRVHGKDSKDGLYLSNGRPHPECVIAWFLQQLATRWAAYELPFAQLRHQQPRIAPTTVVFWAE